MSERPVHPDRSKSGAAQAAIATTAAHKRDALRLHHERLASLEEPVDG